MMFMMGVMLFASLVMMPQFLQTLIGYTAESAGLVLSGGGVLLLFLMPIVGALTSRVQTRYLIAFGWLALSIAMFYATQTLSLQITFQTAALLRATQAFGLGCLFVPITLVSYIGMSPEKSGNVAGLVNFMRNIGASIGTSLVITVIARRAQSHQVDMVAHATLGQVRFVQAVDALSTRLAASGLDSSRAAQQAYARLYNALIAQATALAYIDAFWILCIGSGVMFLLSFALKKNKPGGGRQVALE
jgi:MFS transporter, DHA2 family, multidrug resistance protein